MKIGLDYGGVISFAPDGWAKAIKDAQDKGHEFFLVSHATPGSDMQQRADFCNMVGGIVNLSFDDLGHDVPILVMERKANICQEYGIEIFIDDDLHRVEAVGRMCDRCASFYIPQNLWQLGQRIIAALSNESEELE